MTIPCHTCPTCRGIRTLVSQHCPECGEQVLELPGVEKRKPEVASAPEPRTIWVNEYDGQLAVPIFLSEGIAASVLRLDTPVSSSRTVEFVEVIK